MRDDVREAGSMLKQTLLFTCFATTANVTHSVTHQLHAQLHATKSPPRNVPLNTPFNLHSIQQVFKEASAEATEGVENLHEPKSALSDQGVSQHIYGTSQYKLKERQ